MLKTLYIVIPLFPKYGPYKTRDNFTIFLFTQKIEYIYIYIYIYIYNADNIYLQWWFMMQGFVFTIS